LAKLNQPISPTSYLCFPKGLTAVNDMYLNLVAETFESLVDVILRGQYLKHLNCGVVRAQEGLNK
jgi:hypothetical protein